MAVDTVSGKLIRQCSLDVLKVHGIEPLELEVSLMELEPLVEMAQGDVVAAIDFTDPHGGFGAMDLLVATVVPVVAEALSALAARPEEPVAAWRDTEPALHRLIDQVGSSRADSERTDLLQAVRKVLFEAVARRRAAE